MDWNLILLGNSLLAWVTALGAALAINLLVGVVKWAAINRLSKMANKTSTSLDDALITVVRRTHQGLVLLVSLYIGTRYLALPGKTVEALKIVATVAAFMQIGMWASAAFNF